MALEVRPILLPMTRDPAATFISLTIAWMAYESSIVISGQVFESCTTGLRSFSARTSDSAACLRMASLSMEVSPVGGCRRKYRRDFAGIEHVSFDEVGPGAALAELLHGADQREPVQRF